MTGRVVTRGSRVVPRARRIATGLAALLVVGTTAYGAADVADVVPGVLTRDDPAAAAKTLADPVADPRPVADAAGTKAPAPAADALAAELDPLVGNDWLGRRAGVVVRDALTGEVLYDHGGSTPMVPASTQKLLAAAAIAQTSDLSRTMTTKVVTGSSPDEIVLVAGGDTMIAKGAGDPGAVEGRAGMRELAQQVARSRGRTAAGEKLTLRLDATYAAGPRIPSTWAAGDVASGFTQAVTMIGMAGERPEPYQPSPVYPERSALTALQRELRRAGVTVTVEDSAASWRQAAPADAEVLGSVESAPLGEVLAEALSSSDNALTENLARQAALADGETSGDAKDVAAWVRRTLEGAGVDMTGTRLLDTSGLSRGQRVPAQTVSDVMQLGITGSAKDLRGVLTGLPVAGLTGTLQDRFTLAESRPALGIARAKTGTLTGVSGLAGTTVTADGRLLTYVVLADQVPSSTGTLGARSVLDEIVGTLTACGCR